MNKVIVITSIVLLSLIIGVGVAFHKDAKVYIYKGLKSGTLKHDYYSIDVNNSKVNSGEIIYSLEEGVLTPNSSRLWQKFHIQDFRLPLPVSHPLFNIIPRPNGKGENFNIELEFVTQSFTTLATVKLLPKSQLTNAIGSQYLFKIPIFRNFILTKNNSTMWLDLFSRDVENVDLSISAKELAYSLYIWTMRQSIFPKNALSLKFYPPSQLGIVELPSLKRGKRVEQYFLLKGNVIYSFIISYDIDSYQAVNLRSVYFKNIEILEQNNRLSEIIFKEFQGLPQDKKITTEGMYYLLSAWSQDPGNAEFLPNIIQYLERGNNTIQQLTPLYEYAFNNYGTNFSRIEDRKKQDALEKLKENIKREEEKDLENLSDMEVQELSKEKQIEYKLKKAKESKEKAENPNRFIVD